MSRRPHRRTPLTPRRPRSASSPSSSVVRACPRRSAAATDRLPDLRSAHDPRPAHRADVERPQAAALHDRDPATMAPVRSRSAATGRAPAGRSTSTRSSTAATARPGGVETNASVALCRRRARPLPRPAAGDATTCGRRAGPCATARSGSASSTRTRATCRCRARRARARYRESGCGTRRSLPARAAASRSAGATGIRGTSRTSGSTSPACPSGTYTLRAVVDLFGALRRVVRHQQLLVCPALDQRQQGPRRWAAARDAASTTTSYDPYAADAAVGRSAPGSRSAVTRMLFCTYNRDRARRARRVHLALAPAADDEPGPVRRRRRLALRAVDQPGRAAGRHARLRVAQVLPDQPRVAPATPLIVAGPGAASCPPSDDRPLHRRRRHRPPSPPSTRSPTRGSWVRARTGASARPATIVRGRDGPRSFVARSSHRADVPRRPSSGVTLTRQRKVGWTHETTPIPPRLPTLLVSLAAMRSLVLTIPMTSARAASSEPHARTRSATTPRRTRR